MISGPEFAKLLKQLRDEIPLMVESSKFDNASAPSGRTMIESCAVKEVLLRVRVTFEEIVRFPSMLRFGDEIFRPKGGSFNDI